VSNYVRWVVNKGLGWSEISWTGLDETSAVDTIEAQIRFYRERGLSFVWRVHDYDEPDDLGTKLIQAGFALSGHSAVMVVEAASLTESPILPSGVEVVQVVDEAGVDLLIATHEAVFGHNHQDLRRSLIARRKSAPQETEMFIVTAGGSPVSAARIEFLPDRDFAALWGGGTLPEWRGRGIYRALVSVRAQRAQARGFKYLFVLASDQSRPILGRLGFEVISEVSTYSWKPLL
jgi:ribosomal protein S18 acetylase RimI-like enzyme